MTADQEPASHEKVGGIGAPMRKAHGRDNWPTQNASHSISKIRVTIKVAVALVAVSLAVMFFRHAALEGERQRVGDNAGVATNRHSQNYNSRDAHRDIANERMRYAEQHIARLSLLRRDADAAQRAQSAEIDGESRLIRTRLNALNERLANSILRRPNDPLIADAGPFTIDRVKSFIDSYKDWHNDRVELYNKIFATQDQYHQLQGWENEFLRIERESLSRAIGNLSYFEPRKSHLDTLLGREVQYLYSDVYRVKYDLWKQEVGLLEQRQDALGRKMERSRHDGHTQKTSTASLIDPLLTGPWYLSRVIDGDTLEVTGLEQRGVEILHLVNVDAPERGEPGFVEATEYLLQRLRNKQLLVQFEEPGAISRDRYGRVLVYVFAGGVFVNYDIIYNGWARYSTEHGRGRYDRPMRFAEDQAVYNQRGVHAPEQERR